MAGVSAGPVMTALATSGQHFNHLEMSRQGCAAVQTLPVTSWEVEHQETE